jgi:predicted PurR-regulated permease PerM
LVDNLQVLNHLVNFSTTALALFLGITATGLVVMPVTEVISLFVDNTALWDSILSNVRSIPTSNPEAIAMLRPALPALKKGNEQDLLETAQTLTNVNSEFQMDLGTLTQYVLRKGVQIFRFGRF